MSTNYTYKIRKCLYYAFYIFLIILSSSKLDAKPKYKTSKSGLKYKVTQKVKKGIKIDSFHTVQILFRSMLEDGTVIASSLDKNNPMEFIYANNEVIKGWDEAISYMKIGEKGSFILPAQLAYGDKKVGKIPANSTIILEIELINSFPSFFYPKQQIFSTTESGLRYAVHNKKRSGEKVKAGNYVVIHYTGFTIEANGKRTIFDSSRKTNTSFIVQCGAKKFISGLDEGIMLANVGDSLTVIIPPALGYGAKANQLVPANSTIGFDIYIERQIDPFYEEKVEMVRENGFSYGFFEKKSTVNAKINDMVTVNLIGYYLLANGVPFIFESSYEKKEAQTFRLGKSIENPAWLYVLQQCSVGDRVKLIIDPEMARSELKKLIPENVTVFFEFEVSSIQPLAFLNIADKEEIELSEGLKIIKIQEGNGFELDSADYALIHYTGYTMDSLGNKNVFDSSFDRANPFEVHIGMGKVIKGWDMGLIGRKENDIFRLEIDSELGYGKRGAPPLILQDETLYFDMFIVKTHRPE